MALLPQRMEPLTSRAFGIRTSYMMLSPSIQLQSTLNRQLLSPLPARELANMKLHLSEATSADIDAATQFYGPEKGDFVAPALLHFWPLPSPNDVEVARSRVDWSCQQQKDILENDPTTRFVKVVDLHKDSELVALGRWHRCPNGYVPVGDLEAAGLKDRNDPETWPAGLLKDLYLGLIDGLMSARDAWIGKQHCWSKSFLSRSSLLPSSSRATNRSSLASSNDRENSGAVPKKRSRLHDPRMGPPKSG